MFAMGACYICGEFFMFNPEIVPSIDGQAICEPCIEIVNRERVDMGLPEVHVFPGSYSPMEV